jgi:hypothetical protein
MLKARMRLQVLSCHLAFSSDECINEMKIPNKGHGCRRKLDAIIATFKSCPARKAKWTIVSAGANARKKTFVPSLLLGSRKCQVIAPES